jgi:hypothetical protein
MSRAPAKNRSIASAVRVSNAMADFMLKILRLTAQ